MPQQGYQHQDFPKWVQTGVNSNGEPVGRLVRGPEEEAAVKGAQKAEKPAKPAPGKPASEV